MCPEAALCRGVLSAGDNSLGTPLSPQDRKKRPALRPEASLAGRSRCASKQSLVCTHPSCPDAFSQLLHAVVSERSHSLYLKLHPKVQKRYLGFLLKSGIIVLVFLETWLCSPC